LANVTPQQEQTFFADEYKKRASEIIRLRAQPNLM
jgi:hypothetical protein